MKPPGLALIFALLGAASTPAETTAPQAATPPTAAPQTVAAPAAARVGLALVIGNSKYAQAELPSVDVDRRTMATTLQSLGFIVREVENLQRPRDFEEELRAFLKDENAAPEDTLVVYYSGHGLQIDGRAYVLGTGYTGGGDSSGLIRDYSEDLDKIIRIMEDAAPSARVLIVDACRNNAFASTGRNPGPAFRRQTEDTYLLFADEPGKTVPARSEGTVQSPFTAGLLYAFENSDKGIEDRFQIAREKTRELNPDQNPQMYKSDSSVNRDRPFLDHGGRSPALGSAGHLLDEAEAFYQSRSWDSFRSKISAARVLSGDPTLTARLDKELVFCDLMVAALAAEADATGSRWADAAQSWQKASALFPTRVWVLEKAAVAWLLADRLSEAAAGLGRLRAYEGNPVSTRAVQMLVPLVRLEPGLEAIAKAAANDAKAVLGPEFEKYIKRQ
jgi:hypothetical protein